MKSPTSVCWGWRAVGAAILCLVGVATCSAVPANDNFNLATVIAAAPFTDTEDVTTATTAAGDPYYCYYPYNSVWYSLTRTQSVVVTASTAGSSYDTTLTAFYLAGSLFEVACNDDFNNNLQSQVTFTAQAGVTYYFLVASYGTTAGTLVFSEQETPLPSAPANDSFTNATAITALPYTNRVNTASATTGPEDAYYCYYPYNTVWYTFHATQGGVVSASTVGSDYSAPVQVFTGGPGKFTEVACGFSGVSFNAVAGVTYYLQVSSSSGIGGSLVFTLSELAAPANDSATNAILMTSFPFTNTQFTAGATVGPEDSYYCTYPYQTVWYTLTPTQNARISFTTVGSDYLTIVTVLRGAPGSFTGVACSYGSGGTNTAARVEFDAAAGQTYYFMVGSYYSGGASHLVFSVTEILPPPNDDFNNSLAITNLPSTNTVNTELATRAADDPVDCTTYLGPTAWYSLTPANDEFFLITVLPPGVYGAVSVYTGTRGALQSVTCVGSYGQIGFAASAGQTYYLMVGTYGGGYFSFALRSFPLLKIAVTVDAASPVDSKTGLATVSGTVSSTEPVTIGLAGNVRQQTGRRYLVTSSFGQSGQPPVVVHCPGQATWSVQVLGDTGNFGSGAALVQVGAGAYDPASGQSAAAQATATAQLRGSGK